ncbi:MAG: alpha/beta fold hydrolase [Rhodanobacter sp.]|nr:MAG: alpha/beta fold hydrolase [Rhodanobacter sp.]TAM13339.1 MAG: alpha/beta fold hydrolase [Rhodanobacter sp.]TAM35102.1 MAG: alpha/beta fold hydrolase [Rhodanobacter sp.]
MSTRNGADEPIQFGPQSLFGMYCPAAGSTPRGGVLLCAPIGQEQIRGHRLYRQLAHAMAAAGFAVLRFDCYGTGDSPGESLKVSWPQCLADTATAAAELRRRSGCDQLAAYGTRIGGSLALAAAPAAGLARLILWDPILDGAAYVVQLDAWQEWLRKDPGRYPRPRPAADAAGQWLGFAVSPALRHQLLQWRPEPPAVPTVLLQSAEVATQPVPSSFLAAGVQRRTLATPSPWLDPGRLETTVFAPDMVRAACDCLLGTA